MTTPNTAPVRRWIVRITIGSFSVAALMGIAALLGGGDFGETEGRILLTTLVVGVVSIAVLCYLATAGRPSQPVGVAGGVTAMVPFVTGLVMIWGDLQNGPGEGLLRTFGVGAIVAATLAQVCLLLALGEKAGLLARRLLLGTIALAALVAVLTSMLVLGYDPGGDGFYRALGVVAILDVLGTVVGAALMKFGPNGSSDDRAGSIALPPDLEARLARHAAATGQPRDEVVAVALDRYLTEAPAGPAEPFRRS
jgi:F0F1-type ATP synthase assembly protein I